MRSWLSPPSERPIAPIPVELLVPSHGLAVVGVLDLHPRRPTAHEVVGRLPPLGHDPFEVVLDDLLEEVNPAPRDVRQVLHARSAAWDDSTENPLPLDERQAP